MSNEITTHQEALELFAVSVWQEAESCDDHAAWLRATERLGCVQMFLTLLRQYPAASIANELKAIAAIHAGRQIGFTLDQTRGERQITRPQQNI